MSRHVHVTGVAGVGMSALAQVLRWSFERVTGSDRHYDQGRDLPIWDDLRAAGIELAPQDGSAVMSTTTAVVYSTAIEDGNPDLVAAERLGVPRRHRAAILAELAREKTVLAIGGTAGKTTTTGMVGWILEQAGVDPTVINGGVVIPWRGAGRLGNVRRGSPDAPWVIEVDESDRSLLQFQPEWAILTNISQDHFELAEVQDLFRRFAAQVRAGIVCGEGVAALLGEPRARVVETGPIIEITGAEPVARWRGQLLAVRMPGAHNLHNAVLAAELCAQLGIDPPLIAAALRSFGGIQRRLERVDAGGQGVRVIDDYAHNPAKIAAAWSAVAAPGRRVLGVWRPHGYGPLRAMLRPLAESFAAVCRPEDHLWLLPVYDAGGTADRSIHSGLLLEELKCRGVSASLAPDYAVLAAELARSCQPGDTLLIMGARDPALPVFAREMAARLNPPA